MRYIFPFLGFCSLYPINDVAPNRQDLNMENLLDCSICYGWIHIHITHISHPLPARITLWTRKQRIIYSFIVRFKSGYIWIGSINYSVLCTLSIFIHFIYLEKFIRNANVNEDTDLVDWVAFFSYIFIFYFIQFIPFHASTHTRTHTLYSGAGHVYDLTPQKCYLAYPMLWFHGPRKLRDFPEISNSLKMFNSSREFFGMGPKICQWTFMRGSLNLEQFFFSIHPITLFTRIYLLLNDTAKVQQILSIFIFFP